MDSNAGRHDRPEKYSKGFAPATRRRDRLRDHTRFVVTEMVESVPEKILDRITDSRSRGRLAQPVGGRTWWADASSYITGQV